MNAPRGGRRWGDAPLLRAALVAALLVPVPPRPSGHSLPAVLPNDNRIPAGEWQGDTLVLALDVGMAEWRPEGDAGPAIEVAAFSEAGSSPQVPGPLIRVPAGTPLRVTVRNRLPDSTLSLHGLLTHPAAGDDSVQLAPGAAVTLRFSAGDPGTYFYHGILGVHDFDRDEEREQLAGAFVVDPPGPVPPDRILVLNIWGRMLDSVNYGNALTINGRSWPGTERIHATTGDSLRWRVINASARGHPMHLHGFYFRLGSRGDGRTDTVLPPSAQPLLVTESMRPFSTYTMAWSPDRPGQWLFHCHIGFHVLPDARLEPPALDSPDRMAHDPGRHMAGLVLGIEVAPRAGEQAPPRRQGRQLRLLVQEGTPRGRSPRALGFVLQRGAAPAADSIEIPGSPLILTRDEPTDIVVVNRLAEAAAIHWHGIELESYSDGVPGWSGAPGRLAPSIMPGDSFVARLTLPRAGTFIYHTHLNDLAQLTSGLYGGIVVLEPGQRFDPATDHLLVAGWDGMDDPPHLVVNGDSLPAPLTLAARATHRFRFVNIGPAAPLRFAILRDSTPVTWRRLAKDGADLPPALAVEAPATARLDVGETFDAQVRLPPGRYRLVVGVPGLPAGYDRALRVR
ncbi:MAG: multicopper oxidase domain-containing protein [Gemmatimonadetes bacterium]|nr:multicopper oxidase domain-containing protein [Gemmatimonadota bacterium]